MAELSTQLKMPQVVIHPAQAQDFSMIDQAIEEIKAITEQGEELNESQKNSVVEKLQGLSIAERDSLLDRARDGTRGPVVDIRTRLRKGLNKNSLQFELAQEMLNTGYNRADPKEFLAAMKNYSSLVDYSAYRPELTSVLTAAKKADVAALGLLDLLRPRSYDSKGAPLKGVQKMTPLAFDSHTRLRVAVSNDLHSSAKLLESEQKKNSTLSITQQTVLSDAIELIDQTNKLLDWRAMAGSTVGLDAGAESAARLSAKLGRLARLCGEISAP